MYGMDPFHRDPADHGLEPALELVSYVAEVKLARRGDSVGYGRRFIAERDTWIGTVPIGYGDGYRRGLTGVGEVLVDGRRVPLAGTVSMDNITVDLGDEPVARGTEAVLVGPGRCPPRTGGQLGTINYEITCGLTARVPRVYVRRAGGHAGGAGRGEGVAGRRRRARPAARPRDRRRRPRRPGRPQALREALARETGATAFELAATSARGGWWDRTTRGTSTS